MAASARLMVLMSPEERASLDTKARTLGVSAGEVVRRAVQAFELGTEEEAAELRALIDVFNEIHPDTLRIADANVTAKWPRAWQGRRSVTLWPGAGGRQRRREPLWRRDQGAAPSHPARRACAQHRG